jgi:hypothetical protein
MRDQGGRYAAAQRLLFDQSFDLTDTPSSVRAAQVVARVGGIDLPTPTMRPKRRIAYA